MLMVVGLFVCTEISIVQAHYHPGGNTPGSQNRPDPTPTPGSMAPPARGTPQPGSDDPGYTYSQRTQTGPNTWEIEIGFPNGRVVTIVDADGQGGGYIAPTPPPPSLTFEGRVEDDDTWRTGRIYIAPGNRVDLRLSVSNADSCTATPSSLFGGSVDTNGDNEDTVTPNLQPSVYAAGEDNADTEGNRITYSVTCDGPGGTDTAAITVEVPPILLDMSKAPVPTIVRADGTIEVQWQAELTTALTATDSTDPYALDCTITGATPEAQPYQINLATTPTGSFTSRPLFNTFDTQMLCAAADPNYIPLERVEVIPSVQER